MVIYQNDHLGTPQKLSAINGAVVWSAKYSSFGKAEVDPSSTIVNNFRFPGQYEDNETGLHYNWFRYYEPNAGRYINYDPILSVTFYIDNKANFIIPLLKLFPHIFNGHIYVKNNPNIYSDYEGLGIGHLIKCLYYGSKVAKAQEKCKDELECAVKNRPKYMSETEAEIRWIASHEASYFSDAILNCAKKKVGSKVSAKWVTNCAMAPFGVGPKPQ